MIDISKIKPGDKVAVWQTVKQVANGLVIGLGSFAYAVDEIASHTPASREIKVGDVVICVDPHGFTKFTVIGLHESDAWIYHPSSAPFTVAKSRLRHASECA